MLNIEYQQNLLENALPKLSHTPAILAQQNTGDIKPHVTAPL